MHEDITTFSTTVMPDYPFRIHMAGSSYCDGSYRISRHNSPIYVFEYIEKGCGYLRIDGNEFQAEAGDVYIIPYGSDHEYGSSRKNPWVKHWFNVSGKLVADLLNSYNLNNIYLFKQSPLKDIFINGLKSLKENHTEASSLTGPKIILDIILNLAANIEYLHEKKSISPLGKKLQLYLENKVFDEPLTIADMCKHIKLSPAQTNRIFKKDFGQTPYQYLLNLKISAAEELLTTSIRPVKEIAFSLGFSDEYYFSNIFKQKNGLAPRNYRNKAAHLTS